MTSIDQGFLSIDDLEGDQKELVKILGMEKYLQLVEKFGGSTIYIRKKDSLLQADRNQKIVQDFNGWNFRELGQKYNLAERTIRDIVAEHKQAMRSRPLDDQISMEDHLQSLR